MAKASNPAPKKQPTPPAPNTPSESAASTPAPETTQEHAGAGSVKGLRITAKREGFRRAGHAWSVQPTEIPLDDLSDDQVAMLKAETTMLTVEEITLP